MEEQGTITRTKAEAFSAGTLEDLRTAIRGTLIQPGDAGYEQARKVWNGMIDRRPRLIVQCAGTADVISALEFARAHDLVIAVRGGGHNIAGSALCDDGLVIDLSRMRTVRVDPVNKRAYVDPGALLGDVDNETQAFGLATALGINSTTGVAGLTLGGGFGWTSRKLGMTVDNLISADVVTSDGRLVKANAQENPDLFWAIRGGGGNFGIVTNFEFQLHVLGPTVTAGMIVFAMEEATAVFSKLRDHAEGMPDEMAVWAVLRKAPPLPFLAEQYHGRDILVLPFFHSGDPVDARKQLEVVKAFGHPWAVHVEAMPFTAWQKILDPLLAPGARNYWKSHNFATLSDELIAAILHHAAALPSPHTEIAIAMLGGQVSRVAPDATAYSNRGNKFLMNVHGRWETTEEDDKCTAWARSLFTATAPYSTGGVYVNFITEDEHDRVRAAYRPEVWKRLTEVKRKWDPENIFRTNQNIPPAV